MIDGTTDFKGTIVESGTIGNSSYTKWADGNKIILLISF